MNNLPILKRIFKQDDETMNADLAILKRILKGIDDMPEVVKVEDLPILKKILKKESDV